jgi:zinc and cadmium transporter
LWPFLNREVSSLEARHEEDCEVHAFAYTSLVGDGVHNFIDGMLIAATYMLSFELGFLTTLAVIFHEIP